MANIPGGRGGASGGGSWILPELSNTRVEPQVMSDPFHARRKIALSDGVTEKALHTVAAQLSMLLEQVPPELLPQVMFLAGFSAPGAMLVSELHNRARDSRFRGGAPSNYLVGLLNDRVKNYIWSKLGDEDFYYELRETSKRGG